MTADLRNGTGGGRHGRPGPRPRIVPWLLLGLGLTLEMPVALADNLITNGDFESGDTGFSSQYLNYCDRDIGGGCYKVTLYPAEWHAAFDFCRDHTYGETVDYTKGYMLVANGAPTATYVWQQSVPVSTNTNYLFTAYARTVYPNDQYPANLRIQMDTASGCGASNSFEDIGSINAPLGSSVGGPSCDTWTSNYAATSIASGGSTSICIRILNDNTAEAGNDFALDDISLEPDTRVTETVDDTGTTSGTDPVTINVLNNDHPGYVQVGETKTFEILDTNTLDLNPKVGGVDSNLVIPGVGTFAVVSGQFGDYDKAVQFTPVSGFTGKATATYRISTQSGIPSTVATITVTVGTSFCGDGVPYPTTSQWQMLSLPCLPTGTSVVGIFGDDTPSALTTADYYVSGTGWAIFDRPNGAAYEPVGSADPLSTGTGYWFKSHEAPTDNKLQITGTTTPVTVTAANGCASANGCAAVTVSANATANRYYLVGNPFPYAVDWAQVRVRVGGENGTVYTPSAANTANLLSNQIWVWNATNTGYDTYNDSTLGMIGNLAYFKSFWVQAGSDADGQRIELLIPAAVTTHSSLAAPSTTPRLASAAQPWYLAWLDWLIAPAAADDDLSLGLEPEQRPARGWSQRPALMPGAAVVDPIIDLLTTQGIWSQGLSPEEAERAAHAQALATGSEWFVRLTVEEPATGYRDANNVFGQLLTAKNSYDPADLIELPPYAAPWLTLVFPHGDWGDRAGDYTSDYRSAQRLDRRGRPMAGLPAGDWTFEVRADRVGTPVILRWAGDAAILKQSQLIDRTTGRVINPTARAYANGYPVTLTNGKRTFIWRFLGRTKP